MQLQHSSDRRLFLFPPARAWKYLWPGLAQAVLESLLFVALIFLFTGWWPASETVRASPLSFFAFHLPLWLVAAVRVPLRAAGGAYASRVYRSAVTELLDALRSEAAALGLVSIFYLAAAPLLPPHGPPAVQLGTPASWPVWFAVWLALLVAAAVGWRRTIADLRRRGVNHLRTLLVGSGREGRRFVRWHDAHPALGYRIVGVVRTTRAEGGDRFGYDVVADLDGDLAAVVRELAVDLVVLALPAHEAPRAHGALTGVRGPRVRDARLLMENRRPRRRRARPHRRPPRRPGKR